VTYGIATWGNCNNLEYIKSLQALYCRAGRLILVFHENTPSVQVMELTLWDSNCDVCKRSLVKLIYNIASDNMPAMISDLQPWKYCLGNFPRAPVQCWMYERNRWTRISTSTLNGAWGNFFQHLRPRLYIYIWRSSPYNLRGHNKAVVPRFSTYFMKNSVRYWGAVLWNCVSEYFSNSCNFKQFYSKAKSSPIFREITFAIK